MEKNGENETAKADTTSDQTTQTGDQAEAQENRLVDQINYKLTNNGSTDNNQDLGQNTKYVFKVKFLDGHYLVTTYKIKSGKLVKLIDYNFIKSSKMIDTILDWLKLK